MNFGKIVMLSIILAILSFGMVSASENDTLDEVTISDEVLVDDVNEDELGNFRDENASQLQEFIVTRENFHDYFDENGTLRDNVTEGSTLDFRGNIIASEDENYIIEINKPINIISSTKDAYIDLHTQAGSLLGESPGNRFAIVNGGSGTNVSDITFHNTQVWIFNAHNIILDRINVTVEDRRVGSGVGVTSIRANSTNVTVRNSYFYTRNNGGSSSLVLAWADYCTFDNNTIVAEGTVGNLVYLTTYNVDVPVDVIANVGNTIINNKLYGPATPTDICWGFVITGLDAIFSNNYINYAGVGISAQWGKTDSGNITISNNVLVGGASAMMPSNSNIYNNTISGVMVLNYGDIAYNNTVLGGLTIVENSVAYDNNVNKITASTGSNISNLNVATLEVEGNAFVFNATVNELIIKNSGAVILNSTINGNVEIFEMTSYSLLENSTINGSVVFHSTNTNTIRKNKIISSGEYAINLNNAKNCIITDNYIVSASNIGNYAIIGNYISDNQISNNYPINPNANLINIINLTGNSSSNLAFDDEGNLYVVLSDKILSFDFEGNLRWTFSSWGFDAFSGVIINDNILIAPKIGDKIYFINKDTGQEYGSYNIWQASSKFKPVFYNGSIYVTSEYQYGGGNYNLVIVPFISDDLTIINIGGSEPTSEPIIVNDDIVLINTIGGLKIISISSESVINSISNVCAILSNDNIIYAYTNDSIIALTFNAQQLWENGTNGNSLILCGDYLYSVDFNGNLYKYDIATGEEYFVYDLGENFTNSVVINNRLYFASDNGWVYSFSDNGEILWKINLNTSIFSMSSDKNNIIYLASDNSIIKLDWASKINPSLEVMPVNDINIGDDLLININIDSDATGVIQFTVLNESYSQNIINGNVIFNISNLPSGEYSVNITYGGDDRFNQTSVEINFNVNKFNTTITTDYNSNIHLGEDSVLYLSLADDAKGSITVHVDGKNYTVDVLNGIANISISNLSEGIHNMNIQYSGDDKYLESTVNISVNVVDSIKSNNMIRGYNSGLDFKATFYNIDGSLLINQNIVFQINGKNYTVTTDNNGVGKLFIKLAVGTYKIYSINPITGKSKTNTLKILGRITQNKNIVMNYCDGSSYAVKIIGDDGSAVGAGEVVKFTINGKTYNVKTDKKGVASLKIILNPKNYNIQAFYKGFNVKNTIKVKQNLKSSNVKVKKSARKLTLKATLKSMKGKKLAFKLKGKTYVAKTDSKGVAKVNIGKNIIKKLKKGKKYTFTVKYVSNVIKNQVIVK